MPDCQPTYLFQHELSSVVEERVVIASHQSVEGNKVALQTVTHFAFTKVSGGRSLLQIIERRLRRNMPVSPPSDQCAV
jgi:hypothetical protein